MQITTWFKRCYASFSLWEGIIQFEVPNEERSELKVESDAVKFVVSWNFQKLPGTLNIE